MDNYYMNQDKDFINFKQRLSSYREEPDEKLWAGIENSLDKRNSLYKWLSIAGLSLIVLAAVAIVAVPKQEKQEKQSVLENKEMGILDKISELVLPKQTPESDLPSTTYKEKVSTVEQNQQTTFVKDSNVFVPNVQETENLVVKQEEENLVSLESTESRTTQTPTTTKQVGEFKVEHKNTVTEEVETVSSKLFIPNAFTPTGENNKVFMPAYRELKSYEMRIFARNGSQVFVSRDISHGWNGSVKGGLADQGIYVYVIEYTDLEGKTHKQKGDVMLLK